ncbi:hypothetical protein [Asticcacaulis endophyticus]|uniref:Uncharacterized protein n=1 Tax=Asticcacaulis endophyticus TaxID=1395890 RepID=A0A918UM33_9CAUL|nr:hypothetical protein [Asticcacaulis endophyticus]GGZ21633.1 hypothetical protein GCM10011273_02980 [Asticcacaulis endophyticus]
MSEADILKPMSAEVARQTELIALKTISDGMAALQAQVAKLTDSVMSVRDDVIEIKAVRYEAQLASLRLEVEKETVRLSEDFRREMDATNKAVDGVKDRVNKAEIAIGRYGLGLMIIGTIGGASVATILTKLFSG